MRALAPSKTILPIEQHLILESPGSKSFYNVQVWDQTSRNFRRLGSTGQMPNSLESQLSDDPTIQRTQRFMPENSMVSGLQRAAVLYVFGSQQALSEGMPINDVVKDKGSLL